MKPTNILVNEHRIIEQVLNCLERMVERCALEGKLEEAPAREAIGFFRAFAGCSHLAKKETHLFPLVAETKCRQMPPRRLDDTRRPARPLALRAMEEAIEGAAKQRASPNGCNATTARSGVAVPMRSMLRSPTGWRIT